MNERSIRPFTPGRRPARTADSPATIAFGATTPRRPRGPTPPERGRSARPARPLRCGPALRARDARARISRGHEAAGLSFWLAPPAREVRKFTCRSRTEWTRGAVLGLRQAVCRRDGACGERAVLSGPCGLRLFGLGGLLSIGGCGREEPVVCLFAAGLLSFPDCVGGRSSPTRLEKASFVARSASQETLGN